MLQATTEKWILNPRRDVVRKQTLLMLGLMAIPCLFAGAIGVVVGDADTVTAALWLLGFTWICALPAVVLSAMTRLKLAKGRVSLIGPPGVTWWSCKTSDLDVVVAATGYKDKKVYVALNRATNNLVGSFPFDRFDAEDLDGFLAASGCRRSAGAYKYRWRTIILG